GDDFHHNGCLFLPHCFNFLARFDKAREGPVKKYPLGNFEHEVPDGYQFFLDLGPLGNADKRHFKGSAPFWNEMMAHGNYDEFWQSKNLRPHIKNIKPAVLTVGGWFDAENLFGALETYKNTERQSPDHPANSIVVGPWVQGGWECQEGGHLGPGRVNAKTGAHYERHEERPR